MFGIITDVSGRTSESIEGLYTRPQSIIIAMWKDLQYDKWTDRGQEDVVTEHDSDRFARILKESGAKLNG